MSEKIKDDTIYFILWVDSLANNWIAKMLKLKIKRFFFDNDKNINDYVIIDLHKEIDDEKIEKYIEWINKLHTNTIFISLNIENQSQTQDIISNIEQSNLYYFTDFIDKFIDVSQ